MKNINVIDRANTVDELEDQSTGLPFAKTWQDAYKLVAASFALWILALLSLTGFGS